MFMGNQEQSANPIRGWRSPPLHSNRMALCGSRADTKVSLPRPQCHASLPRPQCHVVPAEEDRSRRRRCCCWAQVVVRLVRWPVGPRPGCAASSSELARTKAHSQLRPGRRSSSQASLSSDSSLPSDSSLAPLQRLRGQRLAQRTRPGATAGTDHCRRCRKIARSGSPPPEPGPRSQGHPKANSHRGSSTESELRCRWLLLERSDVAADHSRAAHSTQRQCGRRPRALPRSPRAKARPPPQSPGRSWPPRRPPRPSRAQAQPRSRTPGSHLPAGASELRRRSLWLERATVAACLSRAGY